MSGSISQHRALSENIQSVNHRKKEKKTTHMLVERLNNSSSAEKIRHLGIYIARANNSLEMVCRMPVRLSSSAIKPPISMQLMLLIDNIRPTDPASGLSGEIRLTASDAKDIEFWLRSESAGTTLVISCLNKVENPFRMIDNSKDDHAEIATSLHSSGLISSGRVKPDDIRNKDRQGYPPAWDGERWLLGKPNTNAVTANMAPDTRQKLKRQGARRVKNTKELEELISDKIIYTHFKPGDLSPQNSMGIRTDLRDNLQIKIKSGWVRLSKNESGYFITDGDKKIRVEFTHNRWRTKNTAPGFPPQLNYYPGEQASVKVCCSDGYSETFNLDSEKTLTRNILDHFDAIDDGIIFDTSKSQSTKHEFFSVNKVTITTAESEKSVYYPDNKPGGFKHHTVLFDSVPVNFNQTENIIITPDNDKTATWHPQYPHNINVMKQGTIHSCGYACLAMVAKDLKQERAIDERVIKEFMALKDECSGGVFSSTLSEMMSESGIENRLLHVENPARYIQDKIREEMWSGIVNIDGHFCIITKSDTHQCYFRDPYQGILSVEKTGRLKELKIGRDIIEL